MQKLDFKNLLKDGKIRNVIIICGIIGIALIFLSSFIGIPDGTEKTASNVSQYKEQMQSSVQQMLENIEDVGRASVLLTIENSVEGVYLENNSTKTKEIEPKIRGVVVACSGGDDPIVIQRVMQAVTKALNISTAKVYVTKLQE
ncbi:MAG: hypothetical protein J1E96_00190 [Ruminococcus sp.]|nr:hypothetical protein [Ruminococcus sp.]